MSNEQKQPALAGQVERSVRPVAWTLQSELAAKETTCRAHLWFVDPVNSAWTPLYDQATLDAAVVDAARSVKEHRERLRTVVRTAIAVLERHGDEHGLCADLRRSLGA